MKKIAMIPVRLGSKRVKNKNLRLLGNKPLVSYVIEAALESKVFDEIYLNSESDIFKEIADSYGIKFYKRPDWYSSDEATNDHFSLDFMNNVEGDILIQLLATSPFITSEQIVNFVNQSINFDTLISTSKVKIESLYKGKPINFDPKQITPPSQLLEPVQAYACSLMSWKYNNYKSNMEKYGAGYHGGDGDIGFFELSGYATVDIDEEDDFKLAEAIIKIKNQKPRYYKSGDVYDANRKRVLLEDGVSNNTMLEYNKEVTSIKNIINSNPTDEAWSHTLVNSESTCATLIAQMPGEGNRLHYHSDWDEWWHIIQGQWEWYVDGKTLTVSEGDLVFIERNKRHKITAIGKGLSIRLAVSREDIDHIYEHI
jgi:CMP-N-acetylneuraminic acid synthetase/quercetin dioxygenase-like cupin family protein